MPPLPSLPSPHLHSSPQVAVGEQGENWRGEKAKCVPSLPAQRAITMVLSQSEGGEQKKKNCLRS